MQNLSDDELDKLFQKAAQDLKPAYDVDHWKALETKLDEKGKPTSWFNRWSLGIGLAVLVSGSSLLYFSANNSTPDAESSLATSLDREPTPGKKNKKAAAGEEFVPSEKFSTDTLYDNRRAESPDFADMPHPISSVKAQQGQEDQPDPSKESRPMSSDTDPEAVASTQMNAAGQVRPGLSSVPNNPHPSSSMESHPRRENQPEYNDSRGRTSSTPALIGLDPRKSDQSIITQNGPPAYDRNGAGDIGGDEQSPKEQTNRPGLDQDSEYKKGGSARNVNPSTASTTDEHDRDNNTVTDKVDVPSGVNMKDTASEVIAQTQEAPLAKPHAGIGFNETAMQREASLLTDSLSEEKSESKVDPLSMATEKSVEEKQAGYAPRFSLKISVSPDFSSVGYSRFTKPGTNYGVLAEYHFSSRLSVVTGAIWSKKVYNASDVEYNGHKVYEAEGDCRILDIPVNMNFSFGNRRSLSFYAGVGFSSYIMNREDYVFHVKGSYGSSYSYDHNVRGKNNEIFSVLNLSLGAQKQLGPRLALQFEPFVKQSVRGIGEGNLSLSSLGAFLNLRYSLISKQPN